MAICLWRYYFLKFHDIFLQILKSTNIWNSFEIPVDWTFRYSTANFEQIGPAWNLFFKTFGICVDKFTFTLILRNASTQTFSFDVVFVNEIAIFWSYHVLSLFVWGVVKETLLRKVEATIWAFFNKQTRKLLVDIWFLLLRGPFSLSTPHTFINKQQIQEPFRCCVLNRYLSLFFKLNLH